MALDAPLDAQAATALHCESCGATLLVGANVRATVCPYCASPSVIARRPSVDRPSPRFVLAFVLTREAAFDAARRWARAQGVFADAGLRHATADDVRGVYLPAYLYGALARSTYDAEIGENYTTTETYTSTDAKGHATTHTRTVTHTEHRPLRGAHASWVADVVVTASRAIDNLALEWIEPFDLRVLRRYTPALISGWIAEEPSMSRDECLALARGEASSKLGREIDAFMPGDSHREVRYASTVERESADLVLVPVWVIALRYDAGKAPIRVLVNGQTARVFGHAPRSKVKIAIAIALVFLAIALLFWRCTAAR